MRIYRTGFLAIIILISFVGCSSAQEEEQIADADMALTSIAETVQAELTMAVTATLESTFTVTPTLEPTFTAEIPTVTTTVYSASSNTTTYSQAVNLSSCDVAGFVEDVTIPDGTVFEPGGTFTKTWSLSNDGTCTWTSDYVLYFYSGNQMDGPDSQVLVEDDVAPGDTVEISVELVAPEDDGHYTGYWALENASGEHFGIGNYGNPFYVEIYVVDTSGTATLTPTITKTPTITQTSDTTYTPTTANTATTIPSNTATTAPSPTTDTAATEAAAQATNAAATQNAAAATEDAAATNAAATQTAAIGTEDEGGD